MHGCWQLLQVKAINFLLNKLMLRLLKQSYNLARAMQTSEILEGTRIEAVSIKEQRPTLSAGYQPCEPVHTLGLSLPSCSILCTNGETPGKEAGSRLEMMERRAGQLSWPKDRWEREQ